MNNTSKGKGADALRRALYISTAIPYVNAAPHIGFALEVVLADAVARFWRLKGHDVRFITGSDENSLKNVQAAEAEGIPVAELVERNAARFEDLKRVLNLSFDDFLRTSVDPRHAAAVNRIWQACAAKEDFYKKNYKGLYCVGCEQFWRAADLKDGQCPEHLRAPEEVEEENYFFRLSRYQDRLAKLIESDELEIVPRSRKAEVLNFVKEGLEDFSVSRSFKRAHGWGLPVPGDPDQVIYVWFDALVNYIAALDWAADSQDYNRFWATASERVHAIGKGITRFHALYWTGMLLSAGLPLPTKLFVHGYVTVNGEKIGKSRGNVIAPDWLVDNFGRDTLRYFLLRNFAVERDADFTIERLVFDHNADLVGQLGNLLNRTLAMVAKYQDGKVPAPGASTSGDSAFVDLCSALPGKVEGALAVLQSDQALNHIFDVVAAANKYIQDNKPWELAKGKALPDGAAADERLRTVLYNLLESLRLFGLCLTPFLPESAASIASRLGVTVADGDFDVQCAWGLTVPGTVLSADGLIFRKLEHVPVAAPEGEK